MKNQISIIILVHNAPIYVLKTFLSLKKTKDVCYETVAVDNKSGWLTKFLLKTLYNLKFIDKLHFSGENMFFAKGNNFGCSLALEETSHYLLLNSDIKVKNPYWLKLLLDNHKYGISAYGVVKDGENTRADGYCFLIDRDLYDEFKLDENYKWFWSITKLQGQVLAKLNTSVKAYDNHDKLIIHYGGKSGKAFKQVNTQLKSDEIKNFFPKNCNNRVLTLSATELINSN